MKTIVSRFFSTSLCLALGAASVVAQQQQTVRIPGITAVHATSPSQTVEVALTSGGTVDQVRVVTQGSEGRDFQPASETCSGRTFATGQRCTVIVNFTPGAPGERLGAVVLLDQEKRTLGIRPMAASASGPIATFVPGLLNTIAGNGSRFGFSGDGGNASNASLFLPFGAAVDGAGNLYVADTYNNRIREVNAQTNIITTVAGNGTGAYTGDGGPALLSSLNNPTTVTLDSAGNIYVADTHNNVVRKVAAFSGIISTVAGNGTAGFTGDGGAATSATLKAPNGLSLDASGNLYIADTGNNVVRLVSASTGVITTVAGTGLAGYTGNGGRATLATLNAPWGVTVSGSGQLYISDQNNHAVRLVNSAGVISTIVGNGVAGSGGNGGLASAARLNMPSNVVIDVAGNLYISDTGNNRIQKVNPATNVITTIAGSGGYGDGFDATLASLYGPYGIALDAGGNLYIADSGHNRVREVHANQALLAYTPLRVGSVSAPMNQVLENDGTSNLNISAVNAVANAQLDPATTCAGSTALATLAQCTIAADFAPTALNVSGTIVVDSDALNQPSTLTLSGQVESTYPSTVLLSSSPNPSIVNDAVLFNVQVINAGNTVPTGKVTLLDGGTAIATLTLTNGLASVSISTLTVGQHSITASYPGDVNDGPSTSLPLLQVVNVEPANAATTTTLTSSANPVSVGATLTLTATVAAVATGQPAPTGSVSFFDGTTSLGTVTLNSSTASLSLSTLTAGSHSITAVYSGSSSYTSSTSSVLTQVVVAPNTVTTTSLTSNADPIAAGSMLTLVATVAAATQGQSVPTGSVTFMEGSTVLGTGTLAAGTTTFTTSSLSVGTHQITAVYGGSSSYSTSTSPILTEIVVAISTGNTPQFVLTVTPTTLSIQSGAHTTLALSVTAASTFVDTLSFGCAGLPASATCTFSQNQIALAAGATQNLTVVLDTGNPLGNGPTSQVVPLHPGTGGPLLAWLLPGSALLALCFRRQRRTLGVVCTMLALTLGTTIVLSGCGSSGYSVQNTPAGSYTFSIFATGAGTGASYTVPVQLTVTK